MSEKKDSENLPSEEAPSQAESFEANKSSTSETYDMKDFCPGIRIEAKDFDGKWYPAKVSDVDWTENEILVHFENWNTKFDEWIPMDSSRLRPIQKPVLQQKETVKFSKGEEVMAVWSSNQKFPGVIQAVLANDRYDVLFSDGFIKRLKNHKISKLQGGAVRSDVTNFTNIGTKEERRERKRKINVAELFHINKRPRKKGLVHSKSQDIKTYPVSKPQSKSSVVKKPQTSVENKEETIHTETKSNKQSNDKLITPSVSGSSKGLIDSIPAAFEVKYLNGQTETWSKQLYQRSEGRTAGKVDIVILNPQGRKFRSRNEIMKYCEENGIVYSHEAFDFSAKGRPKSKSVVQTPTTKIEPTADDKEKSFLKKGNRRSQPEVPGGSQNIGLSTPTSSEVFSHDMCNKLFIGEYEVVIENGKFVCPVKACAKQFRRENLLHMHMKHYHPEFSKYLDYTPSVTDLAYARTVGNLDAVEVSSLAPRKLGSAEKPEKSSGKAENCRKSIDTFNESFKETKKSKTSENKSETKNQSFKTSSETPSFSTPATANTVTVSEDLIEENSQKNKISLTGMQTPRSTINQNETKSETVTQESKGVTLDCGSVVQKVSESESIASTHNAVKSSRHHRLHNRKKTGRFQGSFSDQIRKKRFLAQDRSRPQNRMGRQQQSQQLRQQLQQVQPPQTSVSIHSSVEETNANTTSQIPAMARFPRTHLNMSNETSGKNNLLTSSKTLSPASEKNQQSKFSFEIIKKDNNNVTEKVEKTDEMDEFHENERNKENKDSEPFYNRRKFLAGLISARKRKERKIKTRLRKRRIKRMRQLNSFGWRFNKEESGHYEENDMPDFNLETRSLCFESSNGNNNSGYTSVNNVFEEKKLPDKCDQGGEELKIEKFQIHEKNNKNPGEFNFASDLKYKASLMDLSNCKNVVLSENTCEKQNHSQHANISEENSVENVVSHLGSLKSSIKDCQEKGGKRIKKRLCQSKSKKPKKRVRFENDISEKWIDVDEEIKDEERMIIKREDANKRRRIDLVREMDQHQHRETNSSSRKENSLTDKKNVSLEQAEGTEDSKSPLAVENDKIEKLRRNEIINCLCGITEEDGLMIQCDLCLCWQHGHCAGILREVDVPDKYTCAICRNPFRARSSMKYLHDQEWLKEGTLPTLSFRSKRDEVINQRRTILKRSHDLSGSITLLAQVIHSLRIKVNIAEKKDHPKLWLWAKKWTEKKPNRLKEESEIKEEKVEEQNEILSNEVKTEGTLNQDEKHLPKAPEPEAPIDSAECRLNLLDHLIHYQTLIDARLSCIESLVAELESMQDDAVNDETPDRYPRTKATVQMILRDLNTMKKIASI